MEGALNLGRAAAEADGHAVVADLVHEKPRPVSQLVSVAISSAWAEVAPNLAGLSQCGSWPTGSYWPATN